MKHVPRLSVKPLLGVVYCRGFLNPQTAVPTSHPKSSVPYRTPYSVPYRPFSRTSIPPLEASPRCRSGFS